MTPAESTDGGRVAGSATSCCVRECARPIRVKARGLCNAHYQRWVKYGDPLASGTGRPDMGLTPTERFWQKVDTSGDCWLWLGNTYWDGYGQFWLNRRQVRAHRFSYEQERGAIPDGMVLDHLCRNRRCVRPGHLEPVTNRENLIRGIAARATP